MAEAKGLGTADKNHLLSEWNVTSQDLDIDKELTDDVVIPEVWKDASRHPWADEKGRRIMNKGLRGIMIDEKEGKPTNKHHIWCDIIYEATTMKEKGGHRHDKGETRLSIPDGAMICRGMYITITKKGRYWAKQQANHMKLLDTGPYEYSQRWVNRLREMTPYVCLSRK